MYSPSYNKVFIIWISEKDISFRDLIFISFYLFFYFIPTKNNLADITFLLQKAVIPKRNHTKPEYKK